MKTLSIVVASVALSLVGAGCKKKEAAPAPAKGSAATAGSAKGSATPAGSGSATPAAGSGSGSSATPAGSGSDAGSAAGSGSAATAPASNLHPLLATLGFPNTALGAEAGQFAFAPNDSTLKSAVEGADHEKGVLGFTVAEIKEVGPTESKVAWMSSEWTVPNAFILPIAKGQTVAKGDVVTSSRYGNDMDRAIVTADGDKPKAIFGITLRASKTDEADLKPEFIKLDGTPLQPGSTVGTPNETAGKWDLGMVLRVEGDQVLVAGHMGHMAVFKKDAVRPVPLKLEKKVGDDVFAVWDTAHFMEAKIKKLDAKTGLITVTLPSPFDKDVVLLPGEVAPAKFE